MVNQSQRISSMLCDKARTAKLSPFDAVQLKSVLLSSLQIGKQSHWPNREAALFRLRQAEIVLWKPDLFDAAMSGNEVFKDVAFDNEWTAFESQLWLNCYDYSDIPGWGDKAERLKSYRDNENHQKNIIKLKKDGVSDEALRRLELDQSYKWGHLGILVWPSVEQQAVHFHEILAETSIGGYILDDCPTVLQYVYPPESSTGRFWMAACLWLKLPITGMSQARLSRGQSKQIRNAGNEHESTIKIIYLRRKETVDKKQSGHKLIEWANQWIVRPHWAKRKLKDGTYRPVYIDSYVKGPKDKPLKRPKDYVFKVKR